MGNIFSENPAIAITAVLTLFGILVGHRLYLYRDRKGRFEDAAIDLKKTFNLALVDIEGLGGIGKFGFGFEFSDDFRSQRLSYLNFRDFLSKTDQRECDQAWNNYCKYRGSYIYKV